MKLKYLLLSLSDKLELLSFELGVSSKWDDQQIIALSSEIACPLFSQSSLTLHFESFQNEFNLLQMLCKCQLSQSILNSDSTVSELSSDFLESKRYDIFWLNYLI